jgi:phosphonate transport system permease protein
VEGVGAHVRRRLHRRSCLTPTAASAGSRDPLLVGGLVAVAGLVVWSWSYVGVHPSTLVSARAREQASLVLADAWPLRTDGATLRTLLRLAGETLQMSVLALVLAARLPRAGVRRRTMAAAVRALLLVLRGVPPPVWALLLLFVTLPGPLPGALALAGYNLGILGRLMAETVENLDPGPTDALLLAGASPLAAWLYGSLPRVAPRFLVVALYRWEVTVRETVVVGLVGAGGLGNLLADRIAAFDWAGVGSTLVALVVLTLLVDLVSTAARSAVR